MNVYKKSDIPDHLHYKNHRLIHDILVYSKGTVMIGQDGDDPQTYLPEAPRGPGIGIQGQGKHGWDDTSQGYEEEGDFTDMRGVFVANGPAFKEGVRLPWIKLVDEYQVYSCIF